MRTPREGEEKKIGFGAVGGVISWDPEHHMCAGGGGDAVHEEVGIGIDWGLAVMLQEGLSKSPNSTGRPGKAVGCRMQVHTAHEDPSGGELLQSG